MSASSSLPVVVIGAGPVGLAAAAHLVSRGEQPVVVEAGEAAGASIRAWGHVRLFSPWKYLVDEVSGRMLDAAGWQRPPGDELPTGHELVDHYLLPLAALPQLAPAIRLGVTVSAVTRQGLDKLKTDGREGAPFAVVIQRPDGTEERLLAKAVIDTSGTYTAPNPLGANGTLAPGERAAADRIHYGIPDVLGADRARYAGKGVLVVGSGHSAFNVLGELATLAAEAPETTLTWAIRRARDGQMYGGGEADALPARGALGSRMEGLVTSGGVRLERGFRVAAVRRDGERVVVVAENGRMIVADEVIATTGFRPNLSLMGELRMALDPVMEAPVALAPLIDPNIHGCGTVPPHGFAELSHPESNVYTVGMKSYGRAPTFLMLTGYEQVRSVVAALVGDMEAARAVLLTLPETGDCNGPAASATRVDQGAAPSLGDVGLITTIPSGAAASGCCGGPAPAGSNACCALDAEVKSSGGSGCGCSEGKTGDLSVPSAAGIR